MKDETIAKVHEETDDWAYIQELPLSWHGFTLDKTVHIGKDKYDLYRYYNDDWHKSVTIYFHEETKEYKVRLKYGLIEFCKIEFITSDLTTFEKLLRQEFETVLADMETFHPDKLSSIVRNKKIMEWDNDAQLPVEVEGFSLFIAPQAPVKINNGSYIVIDYVDFDIASSFTVYYNIYRNEFFAEARIINIPDVNYDFDSTEIPELVEKLRTKMVLRLQEVRRRALAEQRHIEEKAQHDSD